MTARDADRGLPSASVALQPVGFVRQVAGAGAMMISCGTARVLRVCQCKIYTYSCASEVDLVEHTEPSAMFAILKVSCSSL